MKKEWKPLINYENSYEISNFGEIRSIDRISGKRKGIIKGKFLKQSINHKGYLEVRLFKNSKSISKIVHRLIALNFIPNPLNLPQINHIDGNKTNNFVNNLEWVSNSQNQLHAYKIGLQPSRAGEKNSNASLSDEEVSNIKDLYNSGQSIKNISIHTDIPLGKIRSIIYKRSWKSNITEIIKRDDRKTKKRIEVSVLSAR